jgi:hypothetical protein
MEHPPASAGGKPLSQNQMQCSALISDFQRDRMSIIRSTSSVVNEFRPP